MKNPRSTILSPERAEQAARALAVCASLVVITCAGGTRTVGPVVPVAHEAQGGSGLDAATSGPSTEAGEPPPAEVSTAKKASEPLARFRAALRDLSTGARKEPVRVLWLGDSHTAADFWTDAVRQPLQERHGNGGPGFVFLGLPAYRHAGVNVEREAGWHVAPRKPALCMLQDDGVFGLGGMRAAPDGPKSRVTVTLAKGVVRGRARWDLAFRLPEATARLRVSMTGEEPRVLDATTAVVGSVAHTEWSTGADATFVVEPLSGAPQVFGVSVESTEPGVVLDTLGINGARIGTPLAWAEAPWVAEVSLRKPSLFVAAYGTNEVGDQVAPARYRPELSSLVARVRKATPDADCLIIGPTDRAGPGWTLLPRVAEIDAVERETAAALGCAFFSAREAMGGDGSLRRWAEQDPPMASTDRVHLKPRGYAELGLVVSRVLLGEEPASK